MQIQRAIIDDLDTIMEVYSHARKFMADVGNASQWENGYPKRDLIEQDIKKRNFYIYKNLYAQR